MRFHPVLLLTLALAACGGGGGDSSPATTTSPPPPGVTYTDPVLYSSASNASLASAQEITAVTRHQIAVGGSTLNYTATVGHMTALSLVDAVPEASFFYVAYTLDGADPATRPVTFFYNGGPGSATVWLHLGSFGPKRLVTNAPSTTTPLPFAFVDNSETLLDKSDLVFVDAVSTGLSEAIAPNVNSTFWGVDADAEVFRDFVMRYIAVNNRAASPKFLFGESYGTPRSAVLASLLESAGTSLTGVVLQSSILNYNSNCGIFTKVTISCSAYLPSYGAIGAWLDLTQPAHPPAQIPDYMAQMRTFASTQYDPAARSFLAGGAVTGALVPQLAADTGMAADQWTVHFNMDDTYFHDNLIAGSVIGFYDGRMVAARGTALAAQEDPSSTFYNAPFAAQIVAYLTDLHYTTPSTYVILSNALNTWNFRHAGLSFPDTIPDLGAAMAHNPKLKVFSANGWYDIVTPFYLTEQDIARLGANPNITLHFYQGGHMTYLDDTGRTAEKADVAAFYQAAVGKSAAVPSAPAPLAAETPASPGVTPPAVFLGTKRDPALPDSLQGIAPAPPTHGAALAAQVVDRLRDQFESARGAKRGGLVTREQARASGLGFIANNFDAIDVNRTGAVSFEDVLAFMRSRGANLPQ